MSGSDFPAGQTRPFHVSPAALGSCVEAWSGYPLQFGGMRRHGWQDELAAELARALAPMSFRAGESLAGTYTTTDGGACDAENRLFTNPGASCFPRNVASIRFERGCVPLPEPPVPVDLVAGHLHHYRYCASSEFRTWERDRVLASWARIPRVLAGDGSARPMWLALRRAVATGTIEWQGPALAEGAPFGVHITVHGTAQGPRSAPTISETFVDGVIAAFHAGAPNARAVAQALAPKLPGISADELEQLGRTRLDRRAVLRFAVHREGQLRPAVTVRRALSRRRGDDHT